MNGVFETFMDRYEAARSPALNTVISLRRIIPLFLEFCQGRGREDLDAITREDVIAYLNSLNGTRTSTKKATKGFISLFLNASYSYRMMKEPIGMISFKGPSDIPRAPLKGFSAEEMTLMTRNAARLSLRERIIFHLISKRPMRISELVKMTVGDVNLESRTFTIFKSKNTKTRVLSLPKETWDDLREYMNDGPPREKPLFGLKTRYMDLTIKGIIRKLRVNPNGRGSHAFRHTLIMAMLRDAKIDPAVVASIAGNTPRTIYSNYSTQVSIDEQRRAEKAFDQVQRKTNLQRGRLGC